MKSSDDLSENVTIDENTDEFELLRDILMMVPSEELEMPFVNTDEMVMEPVILGPLINGGMINEIP